MQVKDEGPKKLSLWERNRDRLWLKIPDMILGAVAGLATWPLYIIPCTIGKYLRWVHPQIILEFESNTVRMKQCRAGLAKLFFFIAIPISLVISTVESFLAIGLGFIFRPLYKKYTSKASLPFRFSNFAMLARRARHMGSGRDRYEYNPQQIWTHPPSPQSILLQLVDLTLGFALQMTIANLVYSTMSMVDFVAKAWNRIMGIDPFCVGQKESFSGLRGGQAIVGIIQLLLSPLALVASLVWGVIYRGPVFGLGGVASLRINKLFYRFEGQHLKIRSRHYEYNRGYGKNSNQLVVFDLKHVILTLGVVLIWTLALASIAFSGVTAGIPVLGVVFGAIQTALSGGLGLLHITAIGAQAAMVSSALVTAATAVAGLAIYGLYQLTYGLGRLAAWVNKGLNSLFNRQEGHIEDYMIPKATHVVGISKAHELITRVSAPLATLLTCGRGEELEPRYPNEQLNSVLAKKRAGANDTEGEAILEAILKERGHLLYGAVHVVSGS